MQGNEGKGLESSGFFCIRAESGVLTRQRHAPSCECRCRMPSKKYTAPQSGQPRTLAPRCCGRYPAFLETDRIPASQMFAQIDEDLHENRRESYGPSSVMTHNVLTSKVVGLGAQPKGNQTISCPVSSQRAIIWVTTVQCTGGSDRPKRVGQTCDLGEEDIDRFDPGRRRSG